MANGAFLFAAGVAAALVGTSAVSALNPPPPQQSGYSIADFPDLGKGIAETPGCLGVSTLTQDRSQKQIIAAWFENRKAMERWYYSPMHTGAMSKFFPRLGKSTKPFAAFTDEKAPMLVIASVTPGDKPVGNGSELKVAQIAIEAYTPVPGGVAFGGTFAPSKMEIPGLVRIKGGSGE